MEKADSKPIKLGASTQRLEAPQETKEFADLMAAQKRMRGRPRKLTQREKSSHKDEP
jgi:hypothetical protein